MLLGGILLTIYLTPFCLLAFWFHTGIPGVGDRIHVSDPEIDVSPDGQAGWIVERVNLYNTTVCFGTTNERATVSNGTLARSRIINAARSPNAVVYVNLKVRNCRTVLPHEMFDLVSDSDASRCFCFAPKVWH